MKLLIVFVSIWYVESLSYKPLANTTYIQSVVTKECLTLTFGEEDVLTTEKCDELNRLQRFTIENVDGDFTFISAKGKRVISAYDASDFEGLPIVSIPKPNSTYYDFNLVPLTSNIVTLMNRNFSYCVTVQDALSNFPVTQMVCEKSSDQEFYVIPDILPAQIVTDDVKEVNKEPPVLFPDAEVVLMNEEDSQCLDRGCGRLVGFATCDGSPEQTFKLKYHPERGAYTIESEYLNYGQVLDAFRRTRGTLVMSRPKNGSSEFFVILSSQYYPGKSLLNQGTGQCLTAQKGRARLQPCVPTLAQNIRVVPVTALKYIVTIPMGPIDLRIVPFKRTIENNQYYVLFFINPDENESRCLKLIESELKAVHECDIEDDIPPGRLSFEVLDNKYRIAYEDEYLGTNETQIIFEEAGSTPQLYEINFKESPFFPIVTLKNVANDKCIFASESSILQLSDCDTTTNSSQVKIVLIPHEVYALKNREAKRDSLKYYPVLPNVPYILSIVVKSSDIYRQKYVRNCLFTVNGQGSTAPCGELPYPDKVYFEHVEGGRFRIKDNETNLYYALTQVNDLVLLPTTDNHNPETEIFDIIPINGHKFGPSLQWGVTNSYSRCSKCVNGYNSQLSFGECSGEDSSIFHIRTAVKFVPPEKFQIIYSPELDQCVTVNQTEEEAEGLVYMSPCQKSLDQLFRFNNYTGITYVTTTKLDKDLGIQNGDDYDGAPLVATTPFDYDFQLFYVTVARSSDKFLERIVSFKSGMCLTAGLNSAVGQANYVRQRPCGSLGVQAFQILGAQSKIQLLKQLNSTYFIREKITLDDPRRFTVKLSL